MMTNGGGPSGSSSSKMGIIGYVPGAWDLFHVGHLNILLRARDHCQHLIVGVVTDDALFEAKGNTRLFLLMNGIEIVRHLMIGDEVVTDLSSSKTEVWNRVHFQVPVQGR